MPAPTATTIQGFLTQAFLNKGFIKRSYVNGKLVTDPTSVPDKLAVLISALSNGMSKERALWQANQVVEIPVTSTPGTPSVAPPGAGLP